MDTNKLNITNLTNLWKKYGYTKVSQNNISDHFCSKQWPNRSWQEGNKNLKILAENTPLTHKVATWPFSLHSDFDKKLRTKSGKTWRFDFQQTAMFLNLSDSLFNTSKVTEKLQVTKVKEFKELKQWIEINSLAFGYDLDTNVFENLLNDQEVDMFLGIWEGEAVLTALLYHNEGNTGLHQMGLHPDFQGKGIAKNAMYLLIAYSQLKGSEYMLLQASDAGKNLYLSLGFIEQFKLAYYSF